MRGVLGCGDPTACGEGTRLEGDTCVAVDSQRGGAGAGDGGRHGDAGDAGSGDGPRDSGAMDSGAQGDAGALPDARAEDGNVDAAGGDADGGPPPEAGTPADSGSADTDAGSDAGAGDAGSDPTRIPWLVRAFGPTTTQGVDYSEYPFPHTFELPTAGTHGLAWSPDGDRLRNGPRVYEVPQTEPMQISALGAHVASRWSGDSRHMALAVSEAGVVNLYVVDTNVALPARRLIDTGVFLSGIPGWPFMAWSPTGAHLAYVRDGEVVIATMIDGSPVAPPEAVITLPASYFIASPVLLWEPDGSGVVIHHVLRGNPLLWVGLSGSTLDLQPVSEPETGNFVHADPALTHDGRHLLYRGRQTSDQVWEVFHVDLSGTRPAAAERLHGTLPEGHDVVRLSVSPHGPHAFYVLDDTADDQTIYDRAFLVDLSSFPATEVELSIVGEVAWSADGEHFAVAAGDGESLWLVEVADPTTGSSTEIGTAVSGDKQAPLFSPDGVHLTYETEALNAPRELRLLRTVDAATDATGQRIASVNHDMRALEWSPDARWLVYAQKSRSTDSTSQFMTRVTDGLLSAPLSISTPYAFRP